MKIDRLIGIITVLLQREKVTAPYLAERFEVSRRTISRDIEDICKAGIPVVTLQGSNGGIAIAEGYKIDKTLFTPDELRAVFAGLSSLDSVAQDKKYQKIIDKFFPGRDGQCRSSHVLIDLSSHYKDSLAPKIAAFQGAIEAARRTSFRYYSPSGQRRVLLDPYLVVFQWSSWYIFGYEEAKGGFRLFKLNRLWDLESTEQAFQIRPVPDGDLDFGRYFTDEIHAVILFDPSVRYRLIEEYGPDSFSVCPGGSLRFEAPFTNRDVLLEWVLGFGDKAELIEPKDLRITLRRRLEKSLRRYVES